MPQRADDFEVKLRQTCRELEDEKVCCFSGILCIDPERITLIFYLKNAHDINSSLCHGL
jgi:hypothetical protein